MNRRHTVGIAVLFAVVAAALVGFGSAAVVDSMSPGGTHTPGAVSHR